MPNQFWKHLQKEDSHDTSPAFQQPQWIQSSQQRNLCQCIRGHFPNQRIFLGRETLMNQKRVWDRQGQPGKTPRILMPTSTTVIQAFQQNCCSLISKDVSSQNWEDVQHILTHRQKWPVTLVARTCNVQPSAHDKTLQVAAPKSTMMYQANWNLMWFFANV